MEITISSRKIEISSALAALTNEKISRLERFLDGITHADVHFFEEQNPRIPDSEVCEVTLQGGGHHLRAKVAAPDAFTALEQVTRKLEHQIHKAKTKLVDRHHGNNHRAHQAS